MTNLKMETVKVENKEYIHIPKIVGRHGMLMEVGKTRYEEFLENEGIILTDSNVTSLRGDIYNTKEFVIGLDTLDDYIRNQLYDFVNDGVNPNNYDTICESLIEKMDETTYNECLRNVEHLKEMVDDFYEQIKKR